MKKVFNARFMAEAGIIAAIYFALTVANASFSYGQIQARISEALCVLPFFTPAAVPGLFIGCFFANLAGSPLGVFDVILGSLATLLAAWAAYRIKNKWLLPLPAVIVNALVVGAELYFIAKLPFFESVAYVGAGEAIAAYALGMPLFFLLYKYRKTLFRNDRP